MNWQYISGFFDADESIQLTRIHSNQNPTPVLTFHNNEKNILVEISYFIHNELGINGYLSTKKKSGYTNQFELRYAYFPKVLSLNDHLIVYHPKKKKRLDFIMKLNKLHKRNGKYSDTEKRLLKEFLTHWE